MATAVGSSVTAANDPKIDGLLQGGQWDFGAGPHVLTYSFNLSGVPGAGGWTSGQMAGVQAAFAAWSAVANIQFKQVLSGTYFYQSTADIALSLTGRVQQDTYGAVGEGVFPDTSDAAATAQDLLTDFAPGKTGVTYANPAGDIFFDNIKGDDVQVNNFAVLNPGGYTLELMLHEIGHALGLKHPFDDGGNGKPTFTQLGIGNLDNDNNTIMSYNAQAYYINLSNPSTPMPLDILAIQYLYGVNRNTNTGNNTYYFQANGTVRTIWDAGGYDTLDASTLGAIPGIRLDLRPGAISTYQNPWDNKIVSAIAMSYTPTETQGGAVGPIDNLIERGIGTVGSDEIYGNDANNALLGGAGDDWLYDTTGNDLLDGGTGGDHMSGGIGDDTYIIDNGADYVVENASEGNDSVKTSVILSSPFANVENYIYTGASNWNFTATDADNVIISGGGKDWISTGLGNDTLNGGGGADTLIGGQGDDFYVIDNTGDQVVENAGEGNDTVKSSVLLTALIGNVENYIYTGAANWTFSGTDDDNLLTGGAGLDKLSGGNGNDLLDGGANADTLIGGQGDDTYVIDNAGDKVVEAAGEGTDLVKSSVTLNLAAGAFIGQAIENVTLIGTNAINVTGNSFDNVLKGNSGANIIDGGLGADAMSGGAGNDTYIIDNVSDTVTENANAGIDTVKSALLLTAIANVENYTYAGGSDWNFIGTDAANVVTASSGNDTLDGGAGGDTLIGGSGDDTYVLDNAGDKVIEAANQGHDTIESSVSVNLGAGAFIGQAIEDVTLTGAATIDATGNGLANKLTGNDAANTLNGGVGADTLIGGLGDDTYVIDNLADQVIENAGEGNDTVKSSVILTTLIDNIENYTYTGAANWTFAGDDGDNALTGGAGLDKLTGNGGNDLLNGGANADTLIGGLGDDTYIIDNVGDKVIEASGEGTDLVKSSISINLAAGNFIGQSIENVTLTGGNAINLTGNSLDNALTGNSGANIIDGGIGADSMAGGGGNDTYIVDDAGDTVIENANAGTDTVKTSIAFTTAIDNVENYIFTGLGDWGFTGNALNNVITAGAGNDKLDGGAGADTLTGGLGDDTYIVDNTGDKVIEGLNQGTDTVVLAASYGDKATSYLLGANLENLDASALTAGISLTGNALKNVITGGSGNDKLDGGAGADTLSGGVGDDTYILDNVDDKVIEAAGEGNDTVKSSVVLTALIDNIENYTYTGAANWTFAGDDGNNSLVGGAGLDKLSGGDGNDVLDGGANADTLIGGLGDDTYVVDNAGDKVIEAAGEGIDTIKSSVTLNLSAGAFLGQEIENITLTGNAAIGATGNTLDNKLTGNAGANVLIGGDGNDVLDGGAGADVMVGGFGDDTYFVDNVSDKVTELADQGIDTVFASIGINLGTGLFTGQEIENVTLTGTGNVGATGNALSNTLVGNDGSNVLDGAAGADVLIGGLGDDTYVIDNVGDVVTEDVNGGNDTIKTSLAISSAAANVENYVFVGSGNWNFTGNELSNKIVAGSGNDTLDGGAGADAMSGGLGDDTYYVDDAGDSVAELAGQGTDLIIASVSIDLTATAFAGQEIENITLMGSDPLNATGNGLDNTITGNAGDNVLNGGAGNDTLIGGDGNDTYIISDSIDKIIESTGGGIDTILATASIDLTTSNWFGQEIENVTLAGNADLNIVGSALNNVLTGNTGANYLDGGSGADTLQGGAGNDTYIIDNSGDIVVEAAGGGTDTIKSSVSIDLGTSTWLGQEIENVTLTGSDALTVTGNDLANVLTGNSAANVLNGGLGNDMLDGGAGADVMIGGQGNDTFIVDNVGDVVIEDSGGGNDTVKSSLVTLSTIANVENYTYTGSASWSFTGNSDNNIITGGSGNDILDGGAGGDTLIGGAGNDTYYVDNFLDQVVETANGGIDTVWLSETLPSATQYIENYYYTGTANWYFISNNLDNTLVGSTGNDNIYGAGGNDMIYGGDGNDYLNGGAGADVMTGGAGDDTYVVDSNLDVIHEDPGQGNDTIVFDYGANWSFWWNYSIPDSIENYDFSRQRVSVTFTGTAANNIITGTYYDDRLDGGAGADTLIGGFGNDTYDIDNAGDVVVESYGAGTDTVLTHLPISQGFANVENYTYYGDTSFPAIPTYWTFTATAQDNTVMSWSPATIDGGDGNDILFITSSTSTISSTLTGGAGDDQLTSATWGNDTLQGGDGNDILSGGSGADYLDGGSGIDTVDYRYAAISGVTVSLVSGVPGSRGDAQGDTLVNIENVTGTSYDDILTGDSGNNVLDGLGCIAGHADVLNGGGGYDTYKFNIQFGAENLIINNAVAGGMTASGELDIGPGLTKQALWFTESGQDLVIQALGNYIAGREITIKDWFGSNASAQLSEIILSDGSKIDSGVSQLVAAMATYATATGFNPSSTYQMPTDQTLQSAITAAWHA